MKGFKKILSFILALTMIFSVNLTNKNLSTEVKAFTKFAITSPSYNKLVAAGYIDINWTNANDYGKVKTYKLYVDGKLEATTTKTSYEFYTTKVNYHSAWVEATLSNGEKVYTDTVKFRVSKKGICIDSSMGRHIAPYEINVSWYYNWRLAEFENLKSNPQQGIEFADDFKKIEFVPMVWNSNSLADSERKVNQAVATGAKYVLGYNEPDFKKQANMSVADAVAFWPAFMNKGVRVGSPATAIWPTNSTNWFQPFMNQINANLNLDVDFITIHCYPDNYQGAEMAEWFLTTVVDACWNKYHKPIWITELSTTGEYITRSGTAEFVKAVIPGLDARSYVERYSFFSFDAASRDTKQDDAGLWYYATGALTPAGEIYRDYGNPTTEYKAGNLTNPKKSGQDTKYLNAKKMTTTKKVKKPKKVTIKSVKNLKKRRVKITLKKVKNAAGYQIRICNNKKFRGYWSKTIKKTTYTFKKLKKKKRYYYKARAYAKNGKKKLYGSWSKVKSVKIKK